MLSAQMNPGSPYQALDDLLAQSLAIIPTDLTLATVAGYSSVQAQPFGVANGIVKDQATNTANANILSYNNEVLFDVYELDTFIAPYDWISIPSAPVQEITIGQEIGADKMHLGAGNDYAEGLGGSDSIKSGSGDDEIYGGNGNDTIRAGADNDYVSGGSGDDELRGDSGNDEIHGGNGKDKIDGGSGNDDIYGDAGNDRIRGRDGDDTISGGSGKDRINGDGGSDNLFGGSHHDVIFGDAGSDFLSGEDGNDKLWGGADGDTLMGGDGIDNLYGQGGHDHLNGQAGNDMLTGGAGADTFAFQIGMNADRVGDFEDGIDLLDVSGLGVANMDDMVFVQHSTTLVVTFDADVEAQLTLNNLTLADVTEADFIFA
jgi:Ca2+-binding RTX toxin-like protein